MDGKKIYLAEDELNIRQLIVLFLENDGYQVRAFETGDELFRAFCSEPADLVILDVMMPGSSGFVICSKLREISKVPIVFLTARDTDEDFISGLSLGSDAYVTKPFSPVKLMMQIKAMLRREEMAKGDFPLEGLPQPRPQMGDLKVDEDRLTIYCQDVPLKLTATEYAFLSYLLINQQRAISRNELLAKVWSYDAVIETRATDDTVKRLRRKLKEAGSQVQVETIRGFGFKLTEGAEGS